MARKFKVGDKVKVIVSSPGGNKKFEPGFKKGTVGRVIDYYPVGFLYRYKVKNIFGKKCHFKPRELTLIERKK